LASPFVALAQLQAVLHLSGALQWVDILGLVMLAKANLWDQLDQQRKPEGWFLWFLHIFDDNAKGCSQLFADGRMPDVIPRPLILDEVGTGVVLIFVINAQQCVIWNQHWASWMSAFVLFFSGSFVADGCWWMLTAFARSSFVGRWPRMACAIEKPWSELSGATVDVVIQE